jgi:hypothetical protein
MTNLLDNTCEGIDEEALEQGLTASQRLALHNLLRAAENLLAAIQDATGQFDAECTALDAACTTARTVLRPAGGFTIHEFLAGRREIALIWSVEDVQQVRPDLTAEQAWEVLQEVDRQHDATLGVNWDALTCIADDLFGPAPETAAA